MLVLVMIQHVLTCIARVLSVYLLASSLFESRVCNFMCLHLPKSSLLLHGMVSIESFACTRCMPLRVPSAELVSSFVATYQELGMYSHVLACFRGFAYICMCLHVSNAGCVCSYIEGRAV